MKPLTIRSGQGNYRVDFLDTFDQIASSLQSLPNAGILIDRKVMELYRDQLAPILHGRPVHEAEASEDEKTLGGVGRACDWLQNFNATKQTHLVAIGGGIIQDISTLTSHIYYRGIKWTYLPSTLLGMSDSCIGAKASINLNAYKNQLGVFHSPSHVIIHQGFVNTLDDRDVASGYGEILKLHFIGSDDHLQDLYAAVAAGGLRNADLAKLLRNSLEVKRKVIEIDEYEKDLRRILNFGHTFGHALEAITNHQIPHGLAVAWGMDLVNYLAVRRGMLDEKVFMQVHEFIQAHLPFRLKMHIEAGDLLNASRRDKKVADGQVNLILAERPGSLKVVKTPMDDKLQLEIADYLRLHNVYRM